MTKITITNAQHKVLKAISASALPRKRIAEKCFGGNSVNFVPILGPLVAAKLVKPSELDIDGRTEEAFKATAAGVKLAKGPAPVTARNGDTHQPLPKVGGTITKTYLGKEVMVKVTADGFQFKNKTYTSLTAAAKAVRGSDQEVNGWAFFGLTKPNAKGGK